MVELEAIIKVSQSLDNGSISSRYIDKFDVMGTLDQETTMNEQI